MPIVLAPFLSYSRFSSHRDPTWRGGHQVISYTGFESPCSTKGESCRYSPLETPSALCPPQEAGFTLNQLPLVNLQQTAVNFHQRNSWVERLGLSVQDPVTPCGESFLVPAASATYLRGHSILLVKTNPCKTNLSY